MLNRKKQLYTGVMILGGIALVVDRVVLPSGPTDPAEAIAVGGASATDVPFEVGGAAPDASSSIPEVPFPRGIVSVAPGAELRDLFAPPAPRLPGERLPYETDNDPGGRDGAAGSDHTTSARFVAQHHLQGVLRNGSLRIAIVGDVWVRLGESVDGCTLIGVEGEEAHFECCDGEAVLKVPTPRAPQGD